MGISSGDAQPIERASSPSCAIRWLQGRSNALGGILEMMTSRKNVYRSQSIVVWRCSGMESSTSLIPTTQSPIPGSLRSGRKANTERNNTTLNYLTTHRHKQKTMMSGHLVSFYSFFFPPSNTSAALFSNLIYSFCFLQTGRLYDLSRTVNLPLSLYIQYVCVSLYIYIYIYIYMYTIQREIGGQEKEEIR